MGFLREYLEYAQHNEADMSYHLWSGLFVLSSVAGRRFWLPMGYFTVYPNLYILLVGPPGNRKTTARNIARDILREIGSLQITAEAITREGLIKEMANCPVSWFNPAIGREDVYHPAIVCVSEMKEFMAVSLDNIINFLTDIYDESFYEYKTRNKEPLVIPKPYVTLLACADNDWVSRCFKEDIISGGFSRRTIYVEVLGEHRRIAFPEPPPEALAARLRCLERCRQILEMSGQFTFDDDARDFYKAWYENLKVPREPLLRNFVESAHVQVLKVAMLISLSEENSLQLRLPHVQLAVAWIEDILQGLADSSLSAVSRNDLHKIGKKLVELLRSRGGRLPEKEVRRILWRECTWKELEEVIATFVRTETIKIATEQGKMWIELSEKEASELPRENTRMRLPTWILEGISQMQRTSEQLFPMEPPEDDSRRATTFYGAVPPLPPEPIAPAEPAQPSPSPDATPSESRIPNRSDRPNSTND